MNTQENMTEWCEQCAEHTTDLVRVWYRWGEKVAGEDPTIEHTQLVCERCHSDLQHMTRDEFITTLAW